MNLILHQFKTDCRHFRFWLLAWWTSLVLSVALSRWIGLRDAASELFTLVSFFQALLAIFLIARLVQSDPLVDTTAFWLTRPIRRFHLSWSKTIFLVLFLFLPFLAMLSVTWLWCRGFSVGLWLLAMAQFVPIMTAIFFAVATVAALTKNILKFLLGCIGALALILLFMGLLLTLERIGWLHKPRTPVTSESYRVGIMWLVLAAGMLAAWFFQSFAARRRFSLAAFALALLLAQPICIYWSGGAFLRPTGSAMFRKTIPLTILSDDDSLEDSPGSQILWTHFRIDGLAPHQLVAVTSMDGSFQSDKKKRVGIELKTHERGRWLLDNHEPDVFRTVQGFFPTNTLWFGSLQTRRVGALPISSKIHVPAGEHGHFSGQLDLSIYDLRQLADLPLKEKNITTVTPGHQLGLESIVLTMGGIQLSIVKSVPDLLFNPGGNYDPFLFQSDCIYVLYHPDFGEAYPLASENSYQSAMGAGYGAQSGKADLIFPFPALRARLTGITVQEWLNHARLLVFEPIKQSGVLQASFDQKDYVFQQDRSSDSNYGTHAAGLAAIRAVTLPPHPDPTQIQSYLRTIADNASMDYLNQAAVKMINQKIEAIGDEGVPVLIKMLPFAERFEGVCLNPFLIKHATRDHLPELLQALRRDINLTRFFQQKKWETDAREVLLSMLPDHRLQFSDEALIIIASAQDPKSYPELSWHFVHADWRSLELIEALQKCPGFDLSGAVREAWKLARIGFGSDNPLCLAAAAEGLPEALAISVQKQENGAGYSQPFQKHLVQLTDYHGPDQDLPAWLYRHLNQFRYDPSQRRYVLVE